MLSVSAWLVVGGVHMQKEMSIIYSLGKLGSASPNGLWSASQSAKV